MSDNESIYKLPRPLIAIASQVYLRRSKIQQTPKRASSSMQQELSAKRLIIIERMRQAQSPHFRFHLEQQHHVTIQRKRYARFIDHHKQT